MKRQSRGHVTDCGLPVCYKNLGGDSREVTADDWPGTMRWKVRGICAPLACLLLHLDNSSLHHRGALESRARVSTKQTKVQNDEQLKVRIYLRGTRGHPSTLPVQGQILPKMFAVLWVDECLQRSGKVHHSTTAFHGFR